MANTLEPAQNGCQFPDNTSKLIFLKSKSVSVQVMAWCWTVAKPLLPVIMTLFTDI